MTINSVLNSYSSPSLYSPKNTKAGTAGDATAPIPTKSSISAASLQISDEAKRLYEKSQQANSKNPYWATDTTITTPSGEVIKTQWVDVGKMLDAKLTADDKRVLGFPFHGKSVDDVTARTLLGQTIVDMRDSGMLSGKITKSYLLGNGANQLNLTRDPNFQSAEAHAALMDILSRTDA